MNRIVLVVHDDPVTRARLVARLEKSGLTVRSAASTAEARRNLAEQPAAVAVCPMRLADLPAERVPDHLTSHHEGMPIVAAIGGSEVDEANALLGRSLEDYLLVPAEEGRLVTSVRNVLHRVELEQRASSEDPGPQETGSAPFTRPGEIRHFHQYERDILLHALFTTGWNVKETATRLKIGRATLYRKIDRYNLRSFRQRDAG